MGNQITMLCGVTALLLCNACSNKKEMSEANIVKIAPAITRVEGLYFETGDQIGLSIARKSDVYAENVRMTYDGSIFASGDLTWYDGNEASTLVAYYPYLQSGVPSEVSVGADQTGGCDTFDLLAALKSDVSPSSSAVGMVFRHMMAALRIFVTNNTASPVTEMIVAGTILDAQFDLGSQHIAPKAGSIASPIKTYVVTQDQNYQAVIVPQEAALSLTVKTTDGKVRSTSFASNRFLQGKIYNIDLIVESEILVPTISGEVADWEVGGGLLPDDGGTESETPGDNSMVCLGENYKTVTAGGIVWMAESLRHISADVESGSGVWHPDGQKTQEYIKTYGMLYNFERASALCPSGWRIPTEDDFKALLPVFSTIFPSLVPLAGVYSTKTELFSGIALSGYLMCSTPGAKEQSNKHFYMVKGQLPVIKEDYPNVNGISVRFVKDAK